MKSNNEIVVMGITVAMTLAVIMMLTIPVNAAITSVEYIEGINDNQPVNPGFTTDQMKESTFLYQPSEAYDLKRIEWYTHSGFGNFTIRFREDISGMPGGILREVTFSLSGGSGFQGEDFITAYPVIKGTRYWIGFYTQYETGSHFASDGDIIEEYTDWNLDGVWDIGPASWLRPMVKFYGESAALTATIDIDPNTLNLNSNGKWITAYIELPEDYDVVKIKCSKIELENTIPAASCDRSPESVIGDYDKDNIADLMVKFDKSAVQDILEIGDEIEIIVTGELTDGTPFEGTDTIRVID